MFEMTTLDHRFILPFARSPWPVYGQTSSRVMAFPLSRWSCNALSNPMTADMERAIDAVWDSASVKTAHVQQYWLKRSRSDAGASLKFRFLFQRRLPESSLSTNSRTGVFDRPHTPIKHYF